MNNREKRGVSNDFLNYLVITALAIGLGLYFFSELGTQFMEVVEFTVSEIRSH